MTVLAGMLAGVGGLPATAVVDLSESFPYDANNAGADQSLMDSFVDEETRLRASALARNLIAQAGAGVAPCPNSYFFEKDILVSTRSIVGSYNDLASDWNLNIDLSSIISVAARQFELYNSHTRTVLPDVPSTLAAISVINGSGVTVLADRALPTVLNEYDSMLIDVSVSPEGNPDVDVTLNFELSPGNDIVVTLEGTRINVFAFQPQQEVREGIEFGTEIFKSRSGIEQRHSYRTRPIVTYDYQYRLEDPERLAAINKLMGNGARLFSVPVWFEGQRLGAALSIGATTIPVDTRFADFRDDGNSLVILWRAWNDFEAAAISSLTDTDITLVSPLEKAHSAVVTSVIPLRLAFAGNRARIQRYRRALADFNLNWRLTEATDRERMFAVPAQNTYQGLPIIESPNFVTSRLREGLAQGFESLDSGGGGVEDFFRPADILEATSRKTWITDGFEARWNLRGLFHQLRGRRSAFYISTAGEDFIPTQPLVSGTSALEYSPNEYTEHIGDADPRRDIEVVLKNGTAFRRRIIGSTDDGETLAILTVDSVWPQNVALNEIDRVSLLVKARLGTDNLTLKHERANETTVSAPIVEVLQ